MQWARAALPDGGLAWTATGDMQGTAGYAADGSWRSQTLVGDDGSSVVYAAA